MSNNYVVYHCHSDMSNGVTNIDSVTKYGDYIKRASELGMSALGFSEHGSIFGWYAKKCDIESAGMKYIHAEEFYVTESLKEKVRDNWHCVLIAKNIDGVYELNRMATKSFCREDNHFFYVPRITFEELKATSENIIITTACLGGILNRANEKVQAEFLEYLRANKHRCFLEIQHHNIEDQKQYNLRLLRISEETGVPLIAGTDTHSLNQTHASGRLILQTAKDITFSDEENWDLVFKSYEELCDAYRRQGCLEENVYLGAIENTNTMADMISTFKMDKTPKYPHIYADPEKEFLRKINEGYKNNKYLQERYTREEVIKRVKEEAEVYKKVGAIDFMLMESYLVEWERSVGIQRGYGRGSVSGSLIAYILGITSMDSLKFKLNFFRFLNPSRVTNADIDVDLCGADRDKEKEFLLRDHMKIDGVKASEIITFNTIATKGAVRDVCRALYKGNNDTGSAEGYMEISDTISDMVDSDEDKARSQYPEVFKYVDILKGTIVSIGTHPSGVLVSDRDIASEVGLCTISTSPYPVSMLDMHPLDDLMWVKLDRLGLDNMGVINDTCKLLGIERLTPDNTDLDDEKVWKSIRDDTTLIFQWESNSAQAYLSKFMSDATINVVKGKVPNFSYLKWFSFGNGLLRPACASYRDSVADGTFYDNGFDELNKFLAPEAGHLCMQESIMMFLVRFCGYTQAESDNVRRAIAKKKGTAQLLPEIEERFINYSSQNYNITKEKCAEVIKPFLQVILDASEYGFSWNHSDAYSSIGYISGYLRYYHPLEFLTAALDIFYDNEEKTASITSYANKVGIRIGGIKFRHSRSKYVCDPKENTIYSGMKAIKYLNEDVAESLYGMRNETFNNFFEVIEKFPGNKKQLDILIKLGYFDEFGSIGFLLNAVDIYDQYAGKKLYKKDGDIPESVLNIVKKYSTETEKRYKVTDADAILKELYTIIGERPVPLVSRLKWEQEFLGYIGYRDESMPGVWVVTSVDTKYSPKIGLYRISDGKSAVAKIKKKDYQNCPISFGDALRLTYELRPKMKLINGEWQKSETDKELWLKYYSIYNIKNK